MKITLLPGDGIGVEIVDAAVEVLDAAAKKFGFEIEYDKQLIGGCAIDATGVPCRKKLLLLLKLQTQYSLVQLAVPNGITLLLTSVRKKVSWVFVKHLVFTATCAP